MPQFPGVKRFDSLCDSGPDVCMYMRIPKSGVAPGIDSIEDQDGPLKEMAEESLVGADRALKDDGPARDRQRAVGKTVWACIVVLQGPGHSSQHHDGGEVGIRYKGFVPGACDGSMRVPASWPRKWWRRMSLFRNNE